MHRTCPSVRPAAASVAIIGSAVAPLTHYANLITLTPPPDNGPVLTISNIMKNVTAAASEAELGGDFWNAREGDYLVTTLEEMDCPQPPLHVVTDNSTASGIANRTVKQKRSKAMDMRFYWVQDRVDQNRLRVSWQKGALNKGDYHTKHHSAKHHRVMRPIYLHVPNVST